MNASNKKGETALQYTEQNGHIEVVKLLLKSGAEVDAKNKAGSTALIGASLSGQAEVAPVKLSSSYIAMP